MPATKTPTKAKPTAKKPATEPREISADSGPRYAEMKAMMTPTSAPTPMNGQNFGAAYTWTSMFWGAGSCSGVLLGLLLESIPSRVLNQWELGGQVCAEPGSCDLPGGHRCFPAYLARRKRQPDLGG